MTFATAPAKQQPKEHKVTVTIKYTPNKKQSVFHASPEQEVIYGGAKGGGKSCALVMEAVAYAMEYEGAIIYLFRKKYDDLEANLIYELTNKIPEVITLPNDKEFRVYTYNQGKHQATFWNGSVIKFRHIANYKDAEGYNGRSIDFIGVDELTEHEEKSIQVLLSCMRSPRGFPTRFRGTCNPGNIGHAWVKKRYIDSTLKGNRVIKDAVSGNRIKYIPATVYDNDILMKMDPAYVKRLENLPEARRKAFLLGDWDIYDGQAFPEFSVDIHVVKTFTPPKHWKRWLACDNGYTDPFAWYWFCVDEKGTVYVYREFTRSYDDEKITYKGQAENVVELSTYLEQNDEGELVPTMERFNLKVAGHDAWATEPGKEISKTLIDFYGDGGLTGFTKAITDRRFRKATIHEYLAPYEDENTGELTAKVKIMDCCKYLIEYLPMQVEDEKDAEKYAETEIDHWPDGFGYGLIVHHVGKSKPLPEDVPKIQAHKDKVVNARLGTLRNRMRLS